MATVGEGLLQGDEKWQYSGTKWLDVGKTPTAKLCNDL